MIERKRYISSMCFGRFNNFVTIFISIVVQVHDGVSSWSVPSFHSCFVGQTRWKERSKDFSNSLNYNSNNNRRSNNNPITLRKGLRIQSGLFSTSIQRNAIRSNGITNKSSSISQKKNNNNNNDGMILDDEIIRSLDLDKVFGIVSNYATTRRGQQAFLRLVHKDDESIRQQQSSNRKRGGFDRWNPSSSNRRSILDQTSTAIEYEAQYYNEDDFGLTMVSFMDGTKKNYNIKMAMGVTDVRKQYELVEQAMFVINYNNNPNKERYDSSMKNNQKYVGSVRLPPFIGNNTNADDVVVIESKTTLQNSNGKNSRNIPNNQQGFVWSTKTVNLDDYDDFMYIRPKLWTLENIIQAEKMIEMLLQVYDWSNDNNTTTWVPLLAQIGQQQINAPILRMVYDEIRDSIEIVRVRTVMDPTGSSSYVVRLNENMFPVLQILRKKQSDLQEQLNQQNNIGSKIGNTNIKKLQEDYDSITEDIIAKENDIQMGLVRTIYKHLATINNGFNTIVELDIIFAKAMFASDLNGQIPIVQSNRGTIHVPNFVHPLLIASQIEKDIRTTQTKQHRPVIPIDLELSKKESERALIISGSNGGGKTLALKSFGLVTIFVRFGIPIPIEASPKYESLVRESLTKKSIIVDYFDRILVSIGDNQNVNEGESTYTAQLKKYSTMIEATTAKRLEGNKNRQPPQQTESILVLLDELGSGTEPTVGGAIGQAILENLLENDSCRIVATTHSSRIKALSFHNESFGCASVILTPSTDNENEIDEDNEINSSERLPKTPLRYPEYRLHYGTIGDSYGLDAVARCIPQFPNTVLDRVAELTSVRTSDGIVDPKSDLDQTDESDMKLEYNLALVRSMEENNKASDIAKAKAERNAEQIQLLRQAMITVAASYEKQFAALEQRVDLCYQDMKKQSKDGKVTIEVLGNTLSELRTVRQQVKSTKEVLKEKGLKMIPDSYVLMEGETVFILSRILTDNVQLDELDEFITFKVGRKDYLPVTEQQNMGPDDVVIIPSVSEWIQQNTYDPTIPIDGDSQTTKTEKQLIVKRHDLAIWDYNCVWDDNNDNVQDMKDIRGVQDSKRRLNDVLARIKSDEQKVKLPTTRSSAFSSSRERKAARVKRSSKKKR